jgi:serine/threonine protein kinase
VSSDARGRWRRVDSIVEAALERPLSEREAFLEQACGGDAELRREVESLLAHDRSDGFLEVPAAGEAARLAGVAEPSSLAGRRIGRFEVFERIGSGGMGEVYRAQDARLQRRVAIKRLPAHLSADADRVRRFRQEALATSALNHPNIVTVHEIVEHEGGDLLVTELVDGVTLRERMREGPMPWATLVDIGLQIAKGLAAAHAIGIVHRDVKPENVMLRNDGLVKLLDFGVAKATQGALAADDDGTTPGSIVGTIGYMSPEQARGSPVDARSDVWSVGVILYELATGASPFKGPTPTDRLAARG